MEQEAWDEDDEDFGDFMAKPVENDFYNSPDESLEDEAVKPEKEALESPEKEERQSEGQTGPGAEQRGQASQQEEPEEADKEATGGTPTSPH